MDKLEACMIVTMISFEGDEDNGCLSVFQSWGVFIIVMSSTGGFTMLKSGTELSAFSKMGWRMDTSWVSDPKSNPVQEQLIELVRTDSI